MKDIFKSNLKIPLGTTIYLKDTILSIKGVQGLLSLNFQNSVNTAFSRVRFFQQTLVGVHLGFVLRLAFVGVGFRVESLEQNFLKLKIGFSHLIFIKIPKNVSVVAPKKTLLVLKSLDKQVLYEFAARIRSYKLPDIYKGKGILLKNQIIRLKEGKKK